MKYEKPQTAQEYNKPKRQMLGVDQLDDMGMALIALTRELSVVNDRLMLVEHVLAQKGIDVAAELERLEPDEALQKKLDEASGKIIGSVVTTLAGT
ncbi:MAG: hypothetical protein AAF607_13030 [Pseudomonadota bacterium]